MEGQPVEVIVTGKMSALHASRICACVIFFILISKSTASITENDVQNDAFERKVKLMDGVAVTLPKDGNSSRIAFFEIDTKHGDESVTGRGKQKKLLQRILPMFIMPFLIQSTIVPLFLSMLKFMLFKSLMVGKLALFLILLNAFKNHNAVKG